MMAKKKTQKTDLTQMRENLRVLRELVDRGWAELEAKYAAEGKPLPVRPPGR
jgi:hypothetical protein